ncbi:MAG: hypothetical protein ABSG28_10155 [Methanoregula sp.]|uniref:hypothetical protein n=1 Tax=Methanoregula sp. TaxID=2052170 RepID=UPI003C19358C
MNRKTIPLSLLFAALVVVALFASACMSAPATKEISQPVTPPVSPTETPAAGNDSTVHATIPPAIICNCPMEPVVPVTVTPVAYPDDSRCHCP